MSDAAFKVGNKYCVRCHNSLKNEAGVYTSPSCGHQICRKCYIEIDLTVTCFKKGCSKKLCSSERISTNILRNIGEELAETLNSTHLTSTRRPDKVKNLSVTSVTVNEIDVAWDQPSSGGKPTTYILQKWEYEHSKWLLIDKINSNKTTYCVTNLKPGTLYTIQVKASNNAGESFACDVSQRTKILAPDSPIDIQVRDDTSSSVTVKWSERHGSSKPSAFEIKVKDFQTSNCLQVFSTYRNECFIHDLKPDHRYVFCIAAKNSGGTSSYVDTTHKTKPNGPDKVKNLRITSVTSTGIDVAWDQPSSGGKPTTYILQKKEYRHREWLLIEEINSNETTYCVTDLKPGTSYNIQVIASNDAGKSSANGVLERTKILAPDSTIDIQIHDETSSSVIMKWRVRDGSAKPDFEIKVKDFQTSNVVQVHSTYRNECSIKDLKPDHRYVFCIAAENSGGTSSYLETPHKTKPKNVQSRVSQREVENIGMTNTEDETNIIASRKRQITEEDENQRLINELFDHNSGNASKVSRHESVSDNYYIRGLPNVGMTCYANSILQVLAQTPELITHLQHLMRKFALNTESLAGNLFDVLSDINMEITNTGNDRRQNELVSTNKVYQLVCKVVKSDSSFQIGRQNDSHSFLIALFNAIKNEITKKNTKEEVLAIFEGTFLSRFTYNPCKHNAVSELQMFNTLLVPIDDDYKVSWSIEDGIGSLLKTEEFHNNALPCEKCIHAENKTITEKTMTFERLPKILILQLGKFKQKYRHLEKMHKIVYYSHTLETSLLKPNMARDRKCYRLYGVTLHYGSLSGGHYTAYVRCNGTVNGGEDQWYDCSDSYVRKIPKDRVLDNEQAFLLFYYLSDIN